MPLFWYVFFVLLGLAIASFLNVCADRLPRGGSLLRPPSHCDGCRRRLVVKDLIPVVSYLWLRGRCRYCRARIPIRVLWVELVTGALFAFLFWRYGLTVQFGILAFYTCLFLLVLVIDLEKRLILNVVVYPMLPVALAISSLLGGPGLVPALVGGAIGFGLFFLIVVASRGGMGWGDVKLAGLIGLATGLPQVFVAILLGIFLGGFAAVILLLARLKKRKQAIPFGPFLAVGAVATLLYGQEILAWYLRLMNLG